MRHTMFVLLSGLLFWGSILPVQAQKTGSISGFVRDVETGKPLPGVNVTVLGTQRGAATGDQGYFIIKNLTPGPYTLRVSMIGYRSQTSEEITVTEEAAIEVNFELTPQAIQFAKIVVTATRCNSLVTDVPASTEVVTLDQLSSRNSQNVGEALESVGGLFIKRYGDMGEIKSVSLRGSTEGQVLVLLDGQRLNLPQGGGVDFSDIPLNAIERIEIVRGGHSALYGADAVGGVINIITRTIGLHRGFSGSLKSTVGSFGTQAYEAYGTQKIGPLSYGFSYNRTRSKGDYEYSDNSGNIQTRKNNDLNWNNLFLKLGYEFNNQARLNFTSQYHKTRKGAPGDLENPSLQARREWQKNIYNLSYEGKILPRIDLKIQAHSNHFDQRYQDAGARVLVDSRHQNKAQGVEVQNRLALHPLATFTYGYEYLHQKLQSTDVGKLKRDTHSLFFQSELGPQYLETSILDKIVFLPAVRYDRYSDVGSEITPKLSFIVGRSRDYKLLLRGNVGRSFRVPSFFDLYWPEDEWAAGNPDLKPEYGLNYDAGLVFQYAGLGLWEGEVTYFVNNLRDLIIWAPRSDWKWAPQNIQKARTTGWESRVLWSGLENLINLEVNYTYMKAKDNSDDPTTRGKWLIYRPQHKIDADLKLNYQFCQAHVTYQRVGKRYTVSDNQKWLPAYQLFDSSFGVRFPINDWQITAGIEVKNLWDKRIQVLEGYPVPGREFRFTVGLKY